jgi:mannitol-specific phosphotransferase system IIBC component
MCLKDSASLFFSLSLFFPRGHTLHVLHLRFVPVLFSFVIFVVSSRVCLSACKKSKQARKHQKHEGKQHKNKTQMENSQSVTTKKKSSEAESLNM